MTADDLRTITRALDALPTTLSDAERDTRVKAFFKGDPAGIALARAAINGAVEHHAAYPTTALANTKSALAGILTGVTEDGTFGSAVVSSDIAQTKLVQVFARLSSSEWTTFAAAVDTETTRRGG